MLKHKADVVVNPTAKMQDVSTAGRLRKALRFVGFGRSEKQTINLTDSNADGHCVLVIHVPRGVEMTTRRENGDVVASSGAALERVVANELTAGKYTIEYREVG